MKKLLFIICIFTIIFSACKKYPQGPLISFRSAKNRVTGTWNVDKFYIDNVDSTSEYVQKLNCKIEFTKDIYKNFKGDYIVKLISTDGKILNGYWYLTSPDRHLDISYYGMDIWFDKDTSFNRVGTIGNNNGGLYRILRLTNRELFIETSIYRINLKKE